MNKWLVALKDDKGRCWGKVIEVPKAGDAVQEGGNQARKELPDLGSIVVIRAVRFDLFLEER